MNDLIRDLGWRWTTGAFTLVVSPVSLVSPRTLADWASFVLTVRADPKWPRQGLDASKFALAALDPSGGGWEEAASIVGTVAGATLEFDVPAGTLAHGKNRYAADVWGVGGTAGDSPLVVATWVSVVPAVR